MGSPSVARHWGSGGRSGAARQGLVQFVAGARRLLPPLKFVGGHAGDAVWAFLGNTVQAVSRDAWTNIAIVALVSLLVGASFFAAEAMGMARISVPVFLGVIGALYYLTWRVRGGSHR